MFACCLAAFLAVGGNNGPPNATAIRIPLNAAGEIDCADVVEALGKLADIAVDSSAMDLKLSVRGLGGTIGLSVLRELLGPDVGLAIEPGQIRVVLPPEWWRSLPRIAQIAMQVQGLAAPPDPEARRNPTYGLHALASYHPNDPKRPTVCLLHGLNSTSGSFQHMIPLLENAGYGVVLYDFPFNRDLDRTVPDLVRDWKAFHQKTGDMLAWSVIGHSMGGLIARGYVEGDDYAGDVRSLILIAPPNHGSSMARNQRIVQLVQGLQAAREDGRAAAFDQMNQGIGQASDDMLPGSRFLERLNRRTRRKGVDYHILAGGKGFLTPELRHRIENQLDVFGRGNAFLGGLARLTMATISDQLDELTDGCGDGCVRIAATRLDGVADHVTIPANHVELIRGPLLYPDPGPVACMPRVLEWLPRPE